MSFIFLQKPYFTEQKGLGRIIRTFPRHPLQLFDYYRDALACAAHRPGDLWQLCPGSQPQAKHVHMSPSYPGPHSSTPVSTQFPTGSSAVPSGPVAIVFLHSSGVCKAVPRVLCSASLSPGLASQKSILQYFVDHIAGQGKNCSIAKFCRLCYDSLAALVWRGEMPGEGKGPRWYSWRCSMAPTGRALFPP